MNRMLFGFLTLIAGPLFNLDASLAATPGPRPNIVLIFADDLGWKDVGYQGTDFYETPNIDRLAAEGMVFRAGYAAAGNCAPSRARLISGQYTPRRQKARFSTGKACCPCCAVAVRSSGRQSFGTFPAISTPLSYVDAIRFFGHARSV